MIQKNRSWLLLRYSWCFRWFLTNSWFGCEKGWSFVWMKWIFYDLVIMVTQHESIFIMLLSLQTLTPRQISDIEACILNIRMLQRAQQAKIILCHNVVVNGYSVTCRGLWEIFKKEWGRLSADKTKWGRNIDVVVFCASESFKRAKYQYYVTMWS